jgi:hypothetical protein
MKLLLLLLTFISISSFANEKLGLGVSIGTPIGIHYTYDLPNQKRMEGAVGSILTGSGTSFDSYYVSTMKNQFQVQAYNLDFNYGLGGRAVTGKKSKVGPAGLIGVDHEIDNSQFSVLANGGAAFLFGDGISLDLNLYIGANYHF